MASLSDEYKTSEILSKIDSLNYSCHHLWTGYTDIKNEDKWEDLNGKEMTWQNWGEKEPNNWNGNEDCSILSVDTELFYDVGCMMHVGCHACEISKVVKYEFSFAWSSNQYIQRLIL